MKACEYYKPQTIQEAIALMGRLENARFIAGGTDVMVLIRQKKIAVNALISLRNIKDLGGIEKKDGLWIGSGVTLSAIVKDEFIRQYYSALHDAACNLGCRQIRNVATIGGNICNAAPSADTACPLLVLDAKVVIIRPDPLLAPPPRAGGGKVGEVVEREAAIDDFFLGPNKTVLEKGDLVKCFHLPPFGDDTGSAYIKHTRRQAMDLPILGVAARVTIKKEGENLRCEDVRIAMGVVAPKPIRAKKAEAFLKGKIGSERLFEEAGEIAASEATPRDSIRGEAWYRTEMVKVLTRRALLAAIDRITRP